MPMIVRCDGNGTAIMSAKAVFGLLPDDADFCAMLGEIGVSGYVYVVLKDGRDAVLSMAGDEILLPPEPPAQRQLSLVGPIEDLEDARIFELEAKLLVPVEVTISCWAPNKRAAEEKVTAIMAGHRARTTDFTLEVDREQMLEIFTRLDDDLAAGKLPEYFDAQLSINRTEER